MSEARRRIHEVTKRRLKDIRVGASCLVTSQLPQKYHWRGYARYSTIVKNPHLLDLILSRVY